MTTGLILENLETFTDLDGATNALRHLILDIPRNGQLLAEAQHQALYRVNLVQGHTAL
jgi:hypothetical protein